MRKVYYVIAALILCTAFITSNPNCPTGKTGAPSLSTGSTSNCTSCHGDYSLNPAGGGIVISGLPSTYTPGSSYLFSIKINHATADRKVWGYAIKAIDTVTRAVVGMWSTTNANSSVKGTAGSSSYELSHANAATTTAGANTYTYNNLTWTAPALPTVNQSRVKFYVAVVAGNNNGNEAGDYVYTTTFTSNQYVAPPPPPAVLPTSVTITSVVATGACDTLRTFSVPYEANVNYAWSISGTGNSIILGQRTNSITAITKVAGSAYVTLSNSVGSIPTVSSAFTRALPPTPSAINGSLTPCPNSVSTYTLTVPTPSASQVAPMVYRWTVPANSSITSASADSSSVTVAYGSAFTGGSITAKSQSACNILSAAKSISVGPAKPLDVISSTGFWNACIGSEITYSVVSAVINTGSVYRWTKPANTTIISANGDSSVVTLRFLTGYTGGSLTVKSSTSCGALGTVLSKTLTHINCAPGARLGIEELQQDLSAIYPVPNNGNFTLKIEHSNKTTSIINVSIIDIQGKLVYSGIAKSVNGIVNKNYSLNLQRGVYLLKYIVGDKTNMIKFIVQ